MEFLHYDFKTSMCTCASLHVDVLISVNNVLNWGFPHVIKALSLPIQPNHTQHAFLAHYLLHTCTLRSNKRSLTYKETIIAFRAGTTNAGDVIIHIAINIAVVMMLMFDLMTEIKLTCDITEIMLKETMSD